MTLIKINTEQTKVATLQTANPKLYQMSDCRRHQQLDAKQTKADALYPPKEPNMLTLNVAGIVAPKPTKHLQLPEESQGLKLDYAKTKVNIKRTIVKAASMDTGKETVTRETDDTMTT